MSSTGLVKKRNIRNMFLYALGMFSTMPTMAFIIAGRTISVFTILLPVCCTIMLFMNTRILSLKISKGKACFLLFLASSLISSFVGICYFANTPAYASAPREYIVKVLIYVILAICVFGSNTQTISIEMVLRGLLAGAVINLLWASLDGVVYYLTGTSINNVVFANYIQANDIRYGTLSLILPNGIRAAGFNSDPAHIGYLAPFVFGYGLMYKKIGLIVLPFIALAMSQSVLGVAICFGVACVFLLISKKLQIFIRATGVLLIMIVIVVIASRNEELNRFISPLFDRVLSKFGDSGTESLRITYSFRFVEAAMYSPISVFLGTGFGTASYPFEKAGLIQSSFAFDPENTYVSYLFDTGIIGVIAFICCIWYMFKGTKNMCVAVGYSQVKIYGLICSGILALVGSFFFYHYIMYACQLILIIFGLAWIDKARDDNLGYLNDRAL